MSTPNEDHPEGASTRIRQKIESAIPDANERRAALELVACAIESVDGDRNNAWRLHETPQGLALFTGRLLTCSIGRGRLEISVMGPVGDEARAAVGAEAEENEAWKAVPGGVLLSFPVDRAKAALELLKDPFDRFIDEATARVRRRVSLERHVPEAVAYVASVVGREPCAPVCRPPARLLNFR